MISSVITSRDRKLLGFIGLFLGGLFTAAGLFGVWLQGVVYEFGFPREATFGEIWAAFTWPAAFITLGSLIVTGVILASPLTTSWRGGHRLVAFMCFGGFIIAACFACGYLAASRVAKILN